MISLDSFVRIAHARGVPVIVDAASEYDLTGFLVAGADIVIYSGHKLLGGPTSGIAAGRRDLVRAAYLQNIGIGRGMKIGKETIAGAIAAMEQWMERDHAAIRADETRALDLWQAAIADLPGVTPMRIPDPTNNPLERLQVWIDPARAGATAAQFAEIFGQQDPPLIVRGHEVEKGYFQLDPCNLMAGQAERVRDLIVAVLGDGPTAARVDAHRAAAARNGGTQSYLDWLNPDLPG